MGPIGKFLPKYANVYVTIQSHGLSAGARTRYVTANGVRNGLGRTGGMHASLCTCRCVCVCGGGGGCCRGLPTMARQGGGDMGGGMGGGTLGGGGGGYLGPCHALVSECRESTLRRRGREPANSSSGLVDLTN